MAIPVISPQILDFNKLAAERAAAQGQRLANIKAQMQAPFVQPLLQQQLQQRQAMAPLQQALVQAQIAKTQRAAQQPFAGQILPGPAGQIQAIDILRQRFGAQDPRVVRAQQNLAAEMRLKNARADFYSSNVALKNLPTIRKNQVVSNFENTNAQRQQQGLMPLTFQDWLNSSGANQVSKKEQTTPAETVNHAPMSNIAAPEAQGAPHPAGSAPVMHQNVPPQAQANQLTPGVAKTTPEDFKSENKQAKLLLAKNASDPTIFRQWVNFRNINRTLDSIDPLMIKRYTGPQGIINQKRDLALTLKGQRVPMYEKYNDFISVTLPTITDNIRQAYGTSIDPRLFDVLKGMSNPIKWKNSPIVAGSQLKEIKRLMREREDVLSDYVALNVHEREKAREPTAVSPSPGLAKMSTADLVKAAQGGQ